MKLNLISVSLPVMTALSIATVTARPPPVRDSKFSAVEPELQSRTLQMLGTPKYFNEPGDGEIYGHYDSRYYRGSPVSTAERQRTQHNMIRAYLSTMRTLGYETWLAHGTLLGWWWNGRTLPWDGDLDVQVWASSFARLAASHNMTTHTYTYYEVTEGYFEDTVVETTTEYLLDINPNHIERTRGNWMNVIDARWIDTSNGLFIDITGLSETVPGIWSCKNNHGYSLDALQPMQETMFEGVKAWVPNSYESILTAEYQQKALETTEYEGHHWDEKKQLWLRD